MSEKKCLCCGSIVQIHDRVEYCKYCGSPIINSCSNYNCAELLDDDAAFCPICGDKSTFNNAGIVKPIANRIPKHDILPF